MATKKYDPYERIELKNVCPWGVNTPIGSFEGNSNVYKYTMEQVFGMISEGDIGFCGTDGMGHHAPIQFCQLDQYNRAFRTNATKLPEYTCIEMLDALREIKDKEEFNKKLEEMILTKSDARQAAYLLNVTIDEADWYNWQVTTIRKMVDQKLKINDYAPIPPQTYRYR